MSTVIQVENLSKYYRLGLIGGGTLREDVNRWIAKLQGKPDPLRKIGQSDHGAGVAAVALGAPVLEKHFTLGRVDGGVDSAFEPNDYCTPARRDGRAGHGN